MITTGSGKFFSNGVDLDFLSKCSPEDALETLNGFPSLMLRLLTFPVPTIAALNGTVCIFDNPLLCLLRLPVSVCPNYLTVFQAACCKIGILWDGPLKNLRGNLCKEKLWK